MEIPGLPMQTTLLDPRPKI